MPVLMKNTLIGRRAFGITHAEAERMVRDGVAIQDKVHTGIYEEVTDEERAQGYMTRSMSPVHPLSGKKANFKPAKAIKNDENKGRNDE